MLSINFKKEVAELLEEYGDEVRESLFDAVEETAKETAKKLKNTSPKRTGAYSKGWRSKVERGRLSVKATVYNGKYGSKTHLLENGHVTKNGTDRTFPQTPAHAHIGPVNEWAQKEVQDKFKKKLGG